MTLTHRGQKVCPRTRNSYLSVQKVCTLSSVALTVLYDTYTVPHTDMRPSPLPVEEKPVGMEALEALHNQIQILV